MTLPLLAASIVEVDLNSATTLDALRVLAAQPQLSQRQLSEALGLSLGKTHYLLHALLDKGLVKIQNFRRSDNKLSYAYLLTPKGLREKLKLTRAFVMRKESEFEAMHRTIQQLRAELDESCTECPASRISRTP